MLQQLVSLGTLEFPPEPLDAIVERRLKTIWEQAPCPECGATAIRTWDYTRNRRNTTAFRPWIRAVTQGNRPPFCGCTEFPTEMFN